MIKMNANSQKQRTSMIRHNILPTEIYRSVEHIDRVYTHIYYVDVPLAPFGFDILCVVNNTIDWQSKLIYRCTIENIEHGPDDIIPKDRYPPIISYLFDLIDNSHDKYSICHKLESLDLPRIVDFDFPDGIIVNLPSYLVEKTLAPINSGTRLLTDEDRKRIHDNTGVFDPSPLSPSFTIGGLDYTNKDLGYLVVDNGIPKLKIYENSTRRHSISSTLTRGDSVFVYDQLPGEDPGYWRDQKRLCHLLRDRSKITLDLLYGYIIPSEERAAMMEKRSIPSDLCDMVLRSSDGKEIVIAGELVGFCQTLVDMLSDTVGIDDKAKPDIIIPFDSSSIESLIAWHDYTITCRGIDFFNPPYGGAFAYNPSKSTCWKLLLLMNFLNYRYSKQCSEYPMEYITNGTDEEFVREFGFDDGKLPDMTEREIGSIIKANRDIFMCFATYL
jgi:hypothetical protein